MRFRDATARNTLGHWKPSTVSQVILQSLVRLSEADRHVVLLHVPQTDGSLDKACFLGVTVNFDCVNVIDLRNSQGTNKPHFWVYLGGS